MVYSKQKIAFSGILAATLLLGCFTSSPLRAEERLVHQPVIIDQAPTGKDLTLSVQLAGSQSTEQLLKAYIVRDGELRTLTAQNAFLNVRDIPTYEIIIPAPSEEMSYQFFMHLKDGSVISSQRYSLRRSCVTPDADMTALESIDDPYKRLATATSQAQDLETEIDLYTKAVKVLEELVNTLEGLETEMKAKREA